jgi:hypothetical protein
MGENEKTPQEVTMAFQYFGAYIIYMAKAI